MSGPVQDPLSTIPNAKIPTIIIARKVKGTISAAEATKPGGCWDPPGKDKSLSIFLFRSTTEGIPGRYANTILSFGTSYPVFYQTFV